MDSELIPALFITLFGLGSLYLVFFQITKKRFLQAEQFSPFRNMTPLPDIANYWLVKGFIIVSSIFVTWMGVYLIASLV